ncbi:hypothetical protein E2320_003430 [Naja naja]|nr:hypothetical protein E2320_003430 [Naja naja]
MIIAREAIGGPRRKGSHFVVMIAFHVQMGRFQLNRVHAINHPSGHSAKTLLQEKTGQMKDCKQGIPSCKLMKLSVLVLMLLFRAVSEILNMNCIVGDPVPILHKYYQPGEVIVAGILSQIYIFSNTIHFHEKPSTSLFYDT